VCRVLPFALPLEEYVPPPEEEEEEEEVGLGVGAEEAFNFNSNSLPAVVLLSGVPSFFKPVSLRSLALRMTF